MSRSAVAALTAYTLELREAEIKLNQNESPYDLPRELKQQLFDRVVNREWNRYPDFESQALRSAIAKTYGLLPENILVGNGSNELLAAAIGTFVAPGTPVVIARPTFTLYEKLVAVAGGVAIPVDIDPRSGELPLDAMIRAASPDSVVIVCSPNNPTGGVLPSLSWSAGVSPALRAGASKAGETPALHDLLSTGAVVLFDRAYGDFAFDEMPPLNDRLVTFSTFSKAWGLAGLRVGWLAGTAETCREIRKVKLPYSLNIISEAAAILTMENRQVRDSYVALVRDERERLAAGMRRIPSIEVFPSRANFIAFRTPSAKRVFEDLCARGILVRDISSYAGLANCLRVSIGSPEQNNAFINALKEIA